MTILAAMIMTGPYFGNEISRIADAHFTFVFSGLSTYGVAKGGWDGWLCALGRGLYVRPYAMIPLHKLHGRR